METTRLFLVLVTFIQYHPELWINFLTVPWICFIDASLSNNLGSWLNLSAIPIPVLLLCLGTVRWLFLCLLYYCVWLLISHVVGRQSLLFLGRYRLRYKLISQVVIVLIIYYCLCYPCRRRSSFAGC